jgi:hypothetical protein
VSLITAKAWFSNVLPWSDPYLRFALPNLSDPYLTFFTLLVQQPNGVFAVISTNGAEFVKNRNLGLFSGPSKAGPNGCEISLAFILTHVTALRFGLPVI